MSRCNECGGNRNHCKCPGPATEFQAGAATEPVYGLDLTWIDVATMQPIAPKLDSAGKVSFMLEQPPFSPGDKFTHPRLNGIGQVVTCEKRFDNARFSWAIDDLNGQRFWARECTAVAPVEHTPEIAARPQLTCAVDNELRELEESYERLAMAADSTILAASNSGARMAISVARGRVRSLLASIVDVVTIGEGDRL